MRISPVMIAMATACISGCAWHGAPYSYSAYQAGKTEANQHLKDKGIAAMNIGEPFGENEAEKYLKDQYGIATVLIATGMPTEMDFGRMKGFSEIMGDAARKKYGRDIVGEDEDDVRFGRGRQTGKSC